MVGIGGYYKGTTPSNGIVMILLLTLPIPHLVNISAVTLPTPPTPTTATVKSLILWKQTQSEYMSITHITNSQRVLGDSASCVILYILSSPITVYVCKLICRLVKSVGQWTLSVIWSGKECSKENVWWNCCSIHVIPIIPTSTLLNPFC